MPKKVIVDEQSLIQDYVGGMSIYDVCNTYHVGKVKVKDILARNGIELRKRGAQPTIGELKVPDFRTKKYIERPGYHIVVFDPNTDFSTSDVANASGVLTTYIEKQYNIPTPTLYDRRMHYMKTGDYWWEQWLSVRYDADRPSKKCPYCEWETIDVDNKSGYYCQHINGVHGISPEAHLLLYPEDKNYFIGYVRKAKKDELMIDPRNFVTCPICGRKLFRMTYSHIASHGLMLQEFRQAYPDFQMESELQIEKDRATQKLGNMAERKLSHRSNAEKELCKMLDGLDIKYKMNDRTVLEGKEIDILIEDSKLGIEYNGLQFHCSGGEDDRITKAFVKTRMANEKGYDLIHIFEDEYLNTKELVIDKIKDLLHVNTNVTKIGARQCTIRDISSETAKNFLNAFHLQGGTNASVNLGAFLGEQLIGVMLFKKGHLDMSAEWELTRFATNIRYRCQGLASKMFTHFVREYNPSTVLSFADRRWTIHPTNSMYTKMGFRFMGVTRPSYSYYAKVYSSKEHRCKRYHKLDFRRHILLQKFDTVDESMSEEQMANKLGFYRIYDCGLFRYLWKNDKKNC